MTAATLLAAAAGAAAAGALVELAAAGWPRRRSRRRPRRVALGALAAVGRRLGLAPAWGRADLAARLDAAGRPFGLRPADVVAARAGAALAGALVALPAAGAAPGRLWVVALLGAPAAAATAPDLWLRRRVRRRCERMALELPETLELVRVAVEAGQTPLRALESVGRRRRGPLAGELRRAADQAALGVGHGAALQRLTRGAPLPEVVALAAAVRRSERHGAPLADALAALAAEARAARVRRLHRRAARAAPKIQLVVALLSTPAVLLLVAAAMVDALA